MAPRRPIVIVIDDDLEFVEFVGAIIERENCRAVVATDGLFGLTMARECHASLILVDYSMPGLSGEEVMLALQADPAMADVPRVLMSGHGCPDLRAIPADAFIAKPIDTQSLQRLVRAFTHPRKLPVAEEAPGKADPVAN